MEFVDYTLEDAVAIVTLRRPPVNALNAQLAEELDEAFTKAEDPGIRAVVVTGEPHFAAGADIKGFKAAYDAHGEEMQASRLAEAIRHLEQLAKPAFAAVRGFALGGGLELAMGADFRIFADDARVGQPEIKLGIIPGAGGTVRLPRLVGFQRAKELVMSGRHIDAEEALRIGLADEVVAVDALADRARELAQEWAQGPTVALAAAKTSLNEGWGRPIDEALAIEAEQFRRSFWTDDAQEGVAAFLEKRPPVFRGR